MSPWPFAQERETLPVPSALFFRITIRRPLWERAYSRRRTFPRRKRMKARAASAVSLSPLVDHVVIIVKENHTYDNYFGTFPKSEGDNKLGKEPNPPNVSPDHRHETWMNRSS